MLFNSPITNNCYSTQFPNAYQGYDTLQPGSEQFAYSSRHVQGLKSCIYLSLFNSFLGYSLF